MLPYSGPEELIALRHAVKNYLGREFGLAAVVDAVVCCAFAFWEYFEWGVKVKEAVLAIVTIVSAYWGSHWVRYSTRPSFAFMAAAGVMNGNSWDFLINHRGPKSSESVQITFIDLDRRDAILSQHPAVLTPQDFNSYERILQYPEVNPHGRGQIFALQFMWTPLNLYHEHYTMEITERDRRVHQELQIERANGRWVYATQIRDGETGSPLDVQSCRIPIRRKSTGRLFPADYRIW